MTEHPRELIPVEQVPALDGEILLPNSSIPDDPDDKLPFPPLGKAIPDEIEALDPNWDVSLIATRGHVLVARTQAISSALNMPMTLLLLWCIASIIGSFVGTTITGLIGLGFVAVLAIAAARGMRISPDVKVVSVVMLVIMGLVSLGKLPIGGVYSGGGALPASIKRMFVFDPDSYFDLGGGFKGGPDLAWMGDFRPKPESLSSKDYDALIKAAQADVAAYGKDAANWTNVFALPTKPIVTRPAKALPKYGDHLKDGLVLVPEDFRPVSVIAHTQGQWSISLIVAGGCATVLGPVANGCENSVTADDPLNSNVRRYLAEIQPKPAAEQE